DLQVSLNMIDPFVTADLIATQGQGSTNTTYLAKVRVPDRHGVYSFVVDWKRRGWSYVQTKDTAPVRPFNHDEHPRFLSSSWPYVSGAFSTMVAFVLFVTLWSLVPGDQKLEAKKL
ncbi:Dolichyl-diphosphooligosaccharide-protein glycosyltransferase 48kDa subunit, partial [Violaceomyces palustris]